MSPSCIWILWSYPVIKKIQNGHIDGVTRKKMGKINDVMEVLECVLFFLKMSGKKVDHDHYRPWKCPLEGYIPHVQTNQDAVSVILMVSTEETWERHRFRGAPSSIAHGFLYLCSLTSIHWYVSMKNDHLNKIVVRKLLRKSVCLGFQVLAMMAALTPVV